MKVSNFLYDGLFIKIKEGFATYSSNGLTIRELLFANVLTVKNETFHFVL